MRMIIEESAINDFDIIDEIANNKNICLSSFIDVHTSVSQITALPAAMRYSSSN